MSKGSDEFYKKYNELCKKWSDFRSEYSNYYKDTPEEKRKLNEGEKICDEFKSLRDQIDFRPLLSSFDGIEEYKRILKVINDKYNFVYKFLDNIFIEIAGKEYLEEEEYETDNYDKYYHKYYDDGQDYAQEYAAERRARLDMYEDASDITDESDYWDYIGGDY